MIDNDKRYVVGKEIVTEVRLIIFVYDRINKRIIFKANSPIKNKEKIYNCIRSSYGENNCVSPKILKLKDFEI